MVRVILAAMVAATLACFPANAADDKIVLRMGTLGATEYFYYKGAKRMADYVAEKSGGAIEIEVYANQQLGNERDMIEGMQLGTIDLAVINTPLLASFEPRFQIFDMPFLFDDWSHAERALDGPIGQELLGLLEPKSLKGLAFANNGFRHVLNYKKEIRTPDDLEGLKIRTLDNPAHLAIMNAMGANATPMQYSEVATALRQRTVDGIDFMAPAVITEKIYEAEDHMALTGHVFTGVVYLMSLDLFNGLTPEQQTILEEGARVGAAHETELYNEADAEALETLQRDYGMTITEVDKEAFREATKSVYDQFADKVGTGTIEEVRALAN